MSLLVNTFKLFNLFSFSSDASNIFVYSNVLVSVSIFTLYAQYIYSAVYSTCTTNRKMILALMTKKSISISVTVSKACIYQ